MVRKGCLHDTTLCALFSAAGPEDCGSSHINASVQVLGAQELLDWNAPSPDALFRHRIEISEVNLPVARLFEGHVNALRLIRT